MTRLERTPDTYQSTPSNTAPWNSQIFEVLQKAVSREQGVGVRVAITTQPDQMPHEKFTKFDLMVKFVSLFCHLGFSQTRLTVFLYFSSPVD